MSRHRNRPRTRNRTSRVRPLDPAPGAETTVVRVAGEDGVGAAGAAASLHDAFSQSSGAVQWVQVQGFAGSDELEVIGRGFGLGPEQLSALLFAPQPTVEILDGGGCHLAFRTLVSGTEAHTGHLVILARGSVVATFEEHRSSLLDAVRAEFPREGGRLRQRGADYLVYRLLDAIVDGALPHIDTIADRLDEIEDQVAERLVRDALQELHVLRRGLRTIRRRTSVARRVVSDLLREGDDWIDNRTRPYLVSLEEQCAHVEDLSVHYRDVATDISELVVGMANVRMNEVMRVLAVVSTVFMPLSFLAGIWGMNFEQMPELRWALGYPLALTTMGTTAALLLWWFRRMGWTKAPTPEHDGATQA